MGGRSVCLCVCACVDKTLPAKLLRERKTVVISVILILGKWQYYVCYRSISLRIVMKYDPSALLIDTASGNMLCHVNKNLPSI